MGKPLGIPINIVYLISSKNLWFKTVSKEIFPNTYHLNLVKFYEDIGQLEVQGTYSLRTYVLDQQQLLDRCDFIATYVICNN